MELKKMSKQFLDLNRPRQKAVLIYLDQKMVDSIDRARKTIGFTRRRFIELCIEHALDLK